MIHSECPAWPRFPGLHLLVGTILAVVLAITEPLLLQTLMAVWTSQLGGATRRFRTIHLIGMVATVQVSITSHALRDTLATGTAKLVTPTNNQA